MYSVRVLGNLDIITEWLFEDRVEALAKAKRQAKALKAAKRDAHVMAFNLASMKTIYDKVIGTQRPIEPIYRWGSYVRGPRREGHRDMYYCIPVRFVEYTKQAYPHMIGPIKISHHQALHGFV